MVYPFSKVVTHVIRGNVLGLWKSKPVTSSSLLSPRRAGHWEYLPKAGGFIACSRWWREERTTPPVDRIQNPCTPEGCQPSHPMPSTHTCLLYHFIFATKHRAPIISDLWRVRLHEYLGGVVRGLGGIPQGVGGVADHVHLLAGLKPTHCLSDFMRELKKTSSVWIAATFQETSFHWQEGYAAFTVSASTRSAVQDYIARQEEHHRRKTFREELVEILQKCGIEYDERYLD